MTYDYALRIHGSIFCSIYGSFFILMYFYSNFIYDLLPLIPYLSSLNFFKKINSHRIYYPNVFIHYLLMNLYYKIFSLDIFQKSTTLKNIFSYNYQLKFLTQFFFSIQKTLPSSVHPYVQTYFYHYKSNQCSSI